jgi:hypothetical protein
MKTGQIDVKFSNGIFGSHLVLAIQKPDRAQPLEYQTSLLFGY